MFLIASWTQERFSIKFNFFFFAGWGEDYHQQNRIMSSAIFQSSCYSPDSGGGISKLFGAMDPFGNSKRVIEFLRWKMYKSKNMPTLEYNCREFMGQWKPSVECWRISSFRGGGQAVPWEEHGLRGLAETRGLSKESKKTMDSLPSKHNFISIKILTLCEILLPLKKKQSSNTS